MRATFAFDPRLLKQIEYNRVLGAADVLVIRTAAVPDDEAWYVLQTALATDDATARNGQVGIREGTAGNFTAIVAGSVGNAERGLAFGQPFIMGPRATLEARVGALTLGSTIQLQFNLIRLKLPRALAGLDDIWTMPKPL